MPFQPGPVPDLGIDLTGSPMQTRPSPKRRDPSNVWTVPSCVRPGVSGASHRRGRAHYGYRYRRRFAGVVTLHCPLCDATHHMLNREMIGLPRPRAWLINAARGPLVDEAALYEALSSCRLAAAGSDVLLEEPAGRKIRCLD